MLDLIKLSPTLKRKLITGWCSTFRKLLL